MINLIPEVIRTQIVKEYWIRASSIFLWLICIASLLVIVIALPVYALITYQVDAYTKSAGLATARVAEYDTSTGALVKANKMAEQITRLRLVQNFSDLITMIESKSTDGITITGFSFNREVVIVAPFQVSGKAATRQDLANFREAILKHESVAEAVLPISNLTKDSNIEFSLTVKLKDKAQ